MHNRECRTIHATVLGKVLFGYHLLGLQTMCGIVVLARSKLKQLCTVPQPSWDAPGFPLKAAWLPYGHLCELLVSSAHNSGPVRIEMVSQQIIAGGTSTQATATIMLVHATR